MNCSFYFAIILSVYVYFGVSVKIQYERTFFDVFFKSYPNELVLWKRAIAKYQERDGRYPLVWNHIIEGVKNYEGVLYKVLNRIVDFGPPETILLQPKCKQIILRRENEIAYEKTWLKRCEIKYANYTQIERSQNEHLIINSQARLKSLANLLRLWKLILPRIYVPNNAYKW